MTPSHVASLMAEMTARAGGRVEASPRILPEAAVERLREFAARYAAPCPFAVGDLVTPRADASVNGAGKPHIVVHVGLYGPVFEGEPGSNTFGVRLDMRVAKINEDSVFMHWVESVEFEPWPLPAAATEAAA